MNCPNCNKQITSESLFCPFCGTKTISQQYNMEYNVSEISSLDSPYEHGTEKMKRPRKKPIIISVCSIVIIGIILATVLMLNKKSNTNVVSKNYNKPSLNYREQAYAFLDEVISRYNKQDSEWLSNHYSKQGLDYLNMNIITAESNLRVFFKNYDPVYEKIKEIHNNSNAAYAVIAGAQYQGGDKSYNEFTLIAFKENGDWVFCDNTVLEYETEPKTRKELIDMYPELRDESNDKNEEVSDTLEDDLDSKDVENITEEDTDTNKSFDNTTNEQVVTSDTTHDDNLETSSNSEEIPTCFTCDEGKIEIFVDSYSIEDSTITIKFIDDSDRSLTTNGYPKIIVNGEPKELDFQANAQKYGVDNFMVDVSSGSSTSISYVVDPTLLENGGEITGAVHLGSDAFQTTYKIKFIP